MEGVGGSNPHRRPIPFSHLFYIEQSRDFERREPRNVHFLLVPDAAALLGTFISLHIGVP